jgi:hypothetical protein
MRALTHVLANRAEIKEIGFDEIVLEPSPIQGSYFSHLYMYLTPDREGMYVQVSEALEMESELGMFVGAYRHHELPAVGHDPVLVNTMEQLITAIRNAVDRLRA